jgi:hypothetical protein
MPTAAVREATPRFSIDVGRVDVRGSGVRVAEDGDRAERQAMQSSRYAHRDLAAVRDQDRVDHARRATGPATSVCEPSGRPTTSRNAPAVSNSASRSTRPRRRSSWRSASSMI